MANDWGWYLSSDYGRDRRLLEEIEGLQASAYASSAQSARLSSQLRTLQGSIESRLQALSTAFDAYVELGDVREQLAGYPDTSAVRRDVLAALTVLAQGGTPGPVEDRGIDYWLVDAANEVIRLVQGQPSPDVATQGQVRQEHETFVVAALGWLGHGERVGGRVAPLLVGDGALAAPQVVLWRAVAHGVFGDVLDAVGTVWTADLDQDAATWDRFARDAAAAQGPVGTLRWVDDLVHGRWSPTRAQDAPVADDRAALRGLVDALVGAGLGDERTLLARARVLRARIEDPGAREPDASTEPPRPSTTDLVQQALLDPGAGPAARRTLVGWVREGVAAAAQQVDAAVAAEQPRPTVLSTELGLVDVGPDGADPGRLAVLDGLAVQRWSTSRSALVVPGAIGGAALVLGLVLLATHHAGLGVLALVVAAVGAVVLVRAVLRARNARVELAGQRERLQTRLGQARQTAVAARQASLETRAEVAALTRSITDATAGAGTGPR